MDAVTRTSLNGENKTMKALLTIVHTMPKVLTLPVKAVYFLKSNPAIKQRNIDYAHPIGANGLISAMKSKEYLHRSLIQLRIANLGDEKTIEIGRASCRERV